MQPKNKKPKLDEDSLLGYTTDDFIKSQLEELFSGINQTHSASADQIRDCLLSIKPSKKKTIAEAHDSFRSKKSVWPLPQEIKIPNGNFKFLPPVDVVNVGGVRTGTHLKSSLTSDLLIRLPESFCEPKDYLNGRYLVKRTLFLMHLIPKLMKCDLVSAIKFKYFNKDVLKPVLHVKSKSGDSFNLIPSGCVFKSSLLNHDRNAVRPDKVYDEGVACAEVHTPYYNNSILTDIYSVQYVDFLTVVENSLSLKQALTILKFWCKRKCGGISGHIITTILLHLNLSGLVSSEMDTLTVCKQFWNFLSSNFVSAITAGIIVGDPTNNAGTFGLFIDTSANVCYNTDIVSLKELARHSQVITKLLESRDHNNFISVLTEKVSSLFDLYDVVYKVHIPDATLPDCSLQYCGVQFRGFIDHIKDILCKAYGDRVKEIKIEYELSEPWSRKSAPNRPELVLIGLSIEQSNWTRVVDRGPSADTVEAKTFKEFWGDKSNLRRFQDGSIVQAVVWNGKSAQERRSILTQITQHTLNRHAGVASDSVQELKFESGKIVGREYYEGDGEEQAQKIIKTFSELSKILRKCSKIPLTITSVLGVSPVLRNTDLFPQAEYQVERARKETGLDFNKPSPPFVKAHEIVCHFELSGKWPEDVRGILRLKAAFYLALKEELESMHISAKVNINYIDIARNGFIFRLRFLVPKEEKLRASNISFWVPCSGAQLKVQTVTLPHVSSHLTSLSLKHSAYPLTVRFFKRWVACHCLSNYISDIFCELVVAYIFRSAHNSTPQTATSAFLRVLSFLSSFDWNLYPLIINFNDELSSETLEVYKNFMNTRSSYPDACIVCPQNELSDLTRDSPAKSSLNILKHLAGKAKSSPLDSIFEPNVTSYNVIIHLARNKTGRFVTSQPREHHAKSSHFPVVEFEPVRLYVEELTSAYGHLCLFLYNRYAPSEVGVVLKRAENSEVKFTVNGSMAKVRTESGKVKDNLDVMLSDFDLMGKGLVSNIEVVNLEM
ncbi:hypothetical protein ACHWQZ_G009838 [Mnemiopsis leidyi]